MPSKSLGLFPANLPTGLLFCLELVEITNEIETVGDLKAGERNGVAVWKDIYILFCHCHPPCSLQKITVCNDFNSKFDL